MTATTDRGSLDVLNEKAALLRALHHGEGSGTAGVLVLPNAWDAASAALVAAAGARAVATTSGGVSWSVGGADGQHLTREEMAGAVRRIASAVSVPVTADVEGGYGPGPADVAATVRAVLDAGAVGINLEDSRAPGGPLFDVAAQAERIRAAREAATAHGVPEFVINARTDVHLFGVGEPEQRPDEVRTRARAFAEAGADCLFVPGLLDLAALEELAGTVPVPLNAMAVPGGPSLAELAATGVRRISVGTTLAEVAYGAARRTAREILDTGTFAGCQDAADYAELNGLF